MKTFHAGQKVTINPGVPLPKCPYCGHERGHTAIRVDAEVQRPAPNDRGVCELCFKSSPYGDDFYFVRSGNRFVYVPAAALVAAG